MWYENPFILLLGGLLVGSALIFIAIGFNYLLMPRFVERYLNQRGIPQVINEITIQRVARPGPALRKEDLDFLDSIAQDLD